MLNLLAIILLVGSFVLSAVLTAVARKLAIAAAFVSQPAENRYHQMPVPLGGGIAIFMTLAIFILGSVAVVNFLVAPGHLDWLGPSVTKHSPGFLSILSRLMIVLLCAIVLVVLGLADDKKHLGPFLKLTVQLAVALIAAVFAEIRVEFFIESKIITSVLSALWIVLIINAF